MDVTVERTGHALLLREPGADEQAAAFAAALAPERHRTAVVVAPSAAAALARLDPWLIADLDEHVSTGVRLFDQAGTSVGEVPLARRLADRLGVEVVAPDGELLPLAAGHTFVAGPDAGWVSHGGKTDRRRTGRRFPEPWWQPHLPAELPTGVREIPLGLWIRAAGGPDRAVDPILDALPDPDRPTLVAGAPGEPAPSPLAVAALLRSFPADVRDGVVLTCYGTDLAQLVADALGSTVRALHGVPIDQGLPVDDAFTPGTPGPTWLDSEGTPRWRPFAVESVYRPGHAPVLDRWVAPVPTMTLLAPARYRLAPGWSLDVIARGLLARPDAHPVEPAWLTQTTDHPELVLAAPVPDTVHAALVAVTAGLPSATRELLRITPATPSAAASAARLRTAERLPAARSSDVDTPTIVLTRSQLSRAIAEPRSTPQPPHVQGATPTANPVGTLTAVAASSAGATFSSAAPNSHAISAHANPAVVPANAADSTPVPVTGVDFDPVVDSRESSAPAGSSASVAGSSPHGLPVNANPDRFPAIAVDVNPTGFVVGGDVDLGQASTTTDARVAAGPAPADFLAAPGSGAIPSSPADLTWSAQWSPMDNTPAALPNSTRPGAPTAQVLSQWAPKPPSASPAVSGPTVRGALGSAPTNGAAATSPWAPAVKSAPTAAGGGPTAAPWLQVADASAPVTRKAVHESGDPGGGQNTPKGKRRLKRVLAAVLRPAQPTEEASTAGSRAKREGDPRPTPSGLTPNSGPNGTPNSAPDSASNGTPNWSPTSAPNGAPTRGPERASNGFPNWGPESASNWGSNSAQNAAPKRSPDSASNGAPNWGSNGGPSRVSNGTPHGLQNGAPNSASNGMPNQLSNGAGASNHTPNWVSNSGSNGPLNGAPNWGSHPAPNGVPSWGSSGASHGVANAAPNGWSATGPQGTPRPFPYAAQPSPSNVGQHPLAPSRQAPQWGGSQGGHPAAFVPPVQGPAVAENAPTVALRRAPGVVPSALSDEDTPTTVLQSTPVAPPSSVTAPEDQTPVAVDPLPTPAAALGISAVLAPDSTTPQPAATPPTVDTAPNQTGTTPAPTGPRSPIPFLPQTTTAPTPAQTIPGPAPTALQSTTAPAPQARLPLTIPSHTPAPEARIAAPTPAMAPAAPQAPLPSALPLTTTALTTTAKSAVPTPLLAEHEHEHEQDRDQGQDQTRTPATVETPEPVVVVAADATSSDAQRRAVRAKLGTRYDSATQAVVRLLAERPGLRAAGTDHAAMLTELAVVRVYAENPGSYDAAFQTCLSAGLRRLPTARGVVVRGAARIEHVEGAVVTLTAPMLAVTTVGAAVPGPVELLIWTTTARRLEGLLDHDRAADVVLPAHTALRVLAVEGNRLLLAEVGAPVERALTNLRAAATARAAAEVPSQETDPARWFGALPAA
ncbi:hypothetical protein [Actinokineospora sp. NBRC 105648]|uniref:hypothetical protein n=1 Tax=Actinokineospora sp. NBRC 105648 TaxID=3032206 RepID=UPI0024A090FC|nr:hypothetical protein [Actinokineospora sp. NBRC 105648]GLZ38948.1 hypothetical protein Acsp05_25720 [Actinokineospora sp. NBRC 105648]